MNRVIFILFIFFSATSVVHAENFPTNKNLKVLIDSGEYFQFKNAFEKHLREAPHGRMITNEDFYYYSWYYFLFNKPSGSNLSIETLLGKKDLLLSDTIVAELLEIHFQNDLRLFDYKKADSICNILLSSYPSVMNKETLEATKNAQEITSALINVPSQTIERRGDLDLQYKRDLVSLIRIPVTMNGKTDLFIFDTGANLSALSESEAKKMGVKILDVNFDVTSSSRSAVQSKLGVADKIEIGNVIFRNVIFIILPDKSLSFLGGLYKIRGIIGLPVIAQLGEIQIKKNKHIFSPLTPTESDLRNLGLNGNTPFANVQFYGSFHPYIFDTGAATGILGGKFYSTYSDSLKNIKTSTGHVGGAGGVQKISTLNISNLHYEFGNQKGILKRSMVQLSGSSDAMEEYYGIIGEDIFTQWDVMTINFEQMFVLLK